MKNKEITQRKTKILATLGPSSSTIKKIIELSKAGANAFRLNCSHLNEQSLKDYVKKIRRVEEILNKPIGILVDLQGPKIRIGTVRDNKNFLEKDAIFILDLKKEIGNNKRVTLPHKKIFTSLKKGHPILLDDGKIHLKVTSVKVNEIRTKVVQGGYLKSNKGVNLPQTNIKTSALSKLDKKFASIAVKEGVDWIALSFVQKPNDIKDLRKICLNKVSIMAKIEKPSALDFIDEITSLADGIMIARGDLGVELPIESVPRWQKKIIRVARVKGKPVVVSTQMLESMTTSLTPTRAEVSDVANAVFEGADAVMLSAESASGSYPIETVEMMNKIALNIEKDSNYNDILTSQLEKTPDTTPDAIATAAKTLADELSSPIIVCYTESGSTGIKVSRVRPSQTILTITPVIETARKLSLAWGVLCFLQKDETDLEHMIKLTKATVKKSKLAFPGDKVVIIAGLPLKVQGTTNLIRVTTVK
ncbi:pyruvate kinase [Hyphomicrobiales bacterium]|jgi:pyruvate kinase|nr:pyruvate kinase [Hyphomicrobiales bacterium]